MRFKKEEIKIMFNKKIKAGKTKDQAYKEIALELDYMNKIADCAKHLKPVKNFKEIFKELKSGRIP